MFQLTCIRIPPLPDRVPRTPDGIRQSRSGGTPQSICGEKRSYGLDIYNAKHIGIGRSALFATALRPLKDDFSVSTDNFLIHCKAENVSYKYLSTANIAIAHTHVPVVHDPLERPGGVALWRRGQTGLLHVDSEHGELGRGKLA